MMLLLVLACGAGPDACDGAADCSAGPADGTDGTTTTDGTDGSDATDGADGTDSADGTDGTGGTDGTEPTPTSSGCGLAPRDSAGGVQITLELGAEAGGSRGYWLSLPRDYDPSRAYGLVLGFPGTNWVGRQIQPYLSLENEAGAGDFIFAYPDPLWRDFPVWGTYGGWTLGPHAYPADGNEDLVFTEAVLDDIEASYCIDTSAIFATGHSWGGDMAQVVGCFLGDRIDATVPVAANRPYWFETGGGWTSCTGDAAAWTFFGQADSHFTMQSYPGEYGDECRDFWVDTRGCDDADPFALAWGADGECVAYAGCSSDVRYCLYEASAAHGAPSYYSAAAMDWFVERAGR